MYIPETNRRLPFVYQIIIAAVKNCFFTPSESLTINLIYEKNPCCLLPPGSGIIGLLFSGSEAKRTH
jgi:hypothetical protein